MSSPKYNRTLHLPWSEGRGAEDKIAKSVDSLLGRHIVITEKMDGSNVCLESKGCFARTHVGPPTHKSFDGLKALHAELSYLIGGQYFGEWCYAKHSIKYETLPGYFLMFAIRDGKNLEFWEPWGYVCEVAAELDVPTVPFLWEGEVGSAKELEALTCKLAAMPSACGGEREGVVVRIEEQFRNEDFSKCVMKFVRKNHIQTGDHWKNLEIVKNKLA